MLDMLQLAASKGLEGRVEELKLGQEGLQEAITRMKHGDVRYRFTMTGYDEAFG